MRLTYIIVALIETVYIIVTGIGAYLCLLRIFFIDRSCGRTTICAKCQESFYKCENSWILYEIRVG